MTSIRLTKEFKFEMAHALYGYDGLCKNIHGHSYKLNVTVIGTPINNTQDRKITHTPLTRAYINKELRDPLPQLALRKRNDKHNQIAGGLRALPNYERLMQYHQDQARQSWYHPPLSKALHQ